MCTPMTLTHGAPLIVRRLADNSTAHIAGPWPDASERAASSRSTGSPPAPARAWAARTPCPHTGRTRPCRPSSRPRRHPRNPVGLSAAVHSRRPTRQCPPAPAPGPGPVRLTARDPVARRAQTPSGRRGAPRRSPGASCTGRARRRTTPACAPPRRTACGTRGPTRTTRGSSTCATTTAASSAAAGTRATPRATASSRVRTETAGSRAAPRAAGTASTRRSAAPACAAASGAPSSCSAATTATSARPASAPAVRSGRRRSSCRGASRSGRPGRGRATASPRS